MPGELKGEFQGGNPEVSSEKEYTLQVVLRASETTSRIQTAEEKFGVKIKLDFKPGPPADSRVTKRRGSEGSVESVSAPCPVEIRITGSQLNDEKINQIVRFLKTGEIEEIKN